MRIYSVNSMNSLNNKHSVIVPKFTGNKIRTAKNLASLVPVLGIGGTIGVIGSYACEKAKEKINNKKEELLKDAPPKYREACGILEQGVKNLVDVLKDV